MPNQRRQATPKLEQVAVADLIPYAKNARTHSDAQVASIARSIQEFGWTNPILVDRNRNVLAGHGRLAAAKQLGIESVPVLVLPLEGAAARAYILADNKLAELAGWDMELLRSEILDLQADGVSLELAGFSDAELDDILRAPGSAGGPDPDAAPPLRDPVSRPGDLWLCGNHRVLCADSTKRESYDVLLGGQLVHAIWTDPPYNVAYSSKAGKIDNDNLDAAAFGEFLGAAFGRMFAAVRPGGAIYVAHADTEGLAFRREFEAAGFKLSGVLIWRKDSLVLGRSDYQWIHEPILYGWKPGRAHRWSGGRKQTTFLDLGQPSPFTQIGPAEWAIQIGDEAFIVKGQATVRSVLTDVITEQRPRRNPDHPTMKPTALIERMLRNSARPGDVVLDPFGGSGSTLIACERLGMSARLLELDGRYTDAIVRRYIEFSGRDAKHVVSGKRFAEIEAERNVTP